MRRCLSSPALCPQFFLFLSQVEGRRQCTRKSSLPWTGLDSGKSSSNLARFEPGERDCFFWGVDQPQEFRNRDALSPQKVPHDATPQDSKTWYAFLCVLVPVSIRPLPIASRGSPWAVSSANTPSANTWPVEGGGADQPPKKKKM